MPRVTIRPSGIEIEVEAGESVAEAAWRQGLVWPTKCWGQLDCMACFTTVVDGELSAVEPEEAELDAIRLRMADRVRGPLVRLACQLEVRKPGLVLEKQGVRPAVDGAGGPNAPSQRKVEPSHGRSGHPEQS